MNRTSRALGTTLVVSAFGYAAQGISLIAVPLFLGDLGIGGYGLMVTVMAFTGYLGFADAGLSWGSMILIAQAHGRGGQKEIAHVVRHSAVLAVASGLIVMLALAGISLAAAAGFRLPMFAHHPEADRLILIAGTQVALTLQFGVFYNLLQGLQEGYWAGLYQGLGRILGLTGAMLAAAMTRSVEAVMLVQLAASTLGGIAGAIHVWRRHPWAFTKGSCTDGSQYRVQLRVGAKSFMLQIGRTFGATAPTLGISTVLGPSAVPFYTVPMTLLSAFFTPINSWNSSMQSAYGESWTSGSYDWARTAFKQSLERALLLGGLGVALFFPLGNTFIRLWTHDRLSLDPSVASSVAAIAVMSSLIAAGEYFVAGLNRHRDVAVAELANGLLALVLVAFSIRWLGLGGVGIGMVLAAMLSSVWVLQREIRSHLGPNGFPSYIYVLKVCIAALLGGTAALLMRAAANAESGTKGIHLIISGVVGTAVFLLAALGFRLVVVGEALAFGSRLKRHFFATAP